MTKQVKKALVVGIDNYKSFPLKGCVNDANAIAKVLATNDDGSPNFSVKLMTSPNSEISRSSLRKAVEKLFSTASDMSLLYFFRPWVPKKYWWVFGDYRCCGVR
jgi:hypothetical protein